MRTRFAGLDISFDERVLAPRQWTEAQSRWAADLLPDLPDGDVLELCCGAGQIGLSAVAGSARRLVAVDINPVAACYTTLNARRARVPLAMRLGPMRRMLASEERFPLILADPPWVPTALTSTFPDDPRVAIDGGRLGMALVEQCLQIIDDHLLPGGVAVLQVGPGGEQPRAVATRADVRETRRYPRGTLVLIAQHRSAATL